MILTLLFALSAKADLCKEWSAPLQVGLLDTSIISEASGLAVSRMFPYRLYHDNDSGDGPYFYFTALDGTDTQKIEVPGMTPIDVEDLALGPCKGAQCLFLGDIGDNDSVRSQVELWILPEVESFASPAVVWKHFTLHYPDHAHNAESLAVDPKTGDVLILTKEANVDDGALPAKLFRLSGELIDQTPSEATLTLESLGEIDLPWINSTYTTFGQVATAMDISSDAQRVLILTYENAVEVPLSLLKQNIFSRNWVAGVDYRVLPLEPRQQEGVAYSVDGRSFYFDEEFHPENGDVNAPIFRVDCLSGSL